MNSNPALLEARNVSRRHPEKDDWLLREVTFSLHAGDRVYLAGSAGSGKTLLLRSLAMLDPVDEGEVLWDGKPIENVPAFRSTVMLISQHSILFEGTVDYNLQLPFTFRAYHDRSYDKRRVVEIFREFGRDELFLDKQQSELSGGELQIAALARAMQLDPQILLLDEPASALDENSVAVMESLVNRWLQDNTNRAFVVVTHQAERGRGMANRIVLMHQGRLTEEP